MNIKFQTFLDLPAMKQAKLAAGHIDMNRIIKGAHELDVKECWNWIDSCEVLVLSGGAFENVKEDFITVIQRLQEKKISCIVVKTGLYMARVPEEVVNMADLMDLPIFEVPYGIKANGLIPQIYKELYHEETETNMVERIVRDVLYDEYTEELKNKAIFHGYEANKAYVGLLMEFDNLDDYMETHNIINNEGLIINVYGIIKNVFDRKRTVKTFYLRDNERYVVMVHVDESAESKKTLYKEIDLIQRRVGEIYDGLTLSVGIGKHFYKLTDLKKSIVEAKRTIQMVRSGKGENSIGNYDEIGIFRLFFELQDYEVFESTMKTILGRLMEYDIENNTNLVDTLEVYLNFDRNISKASDALFLHRNTLKYKLNRIEAVLACDLYDVNTYFNLMLAYKIKSFLTNSIFF